MNSSGVEVEAPRTSAPLVLFDGVCNLCNATVQWILRHDRRGAFRFAPLQSLGAAAELDAVPAVERPDTIVLIDERGWHVESEAVIRIAQRLGGVWALAPIARVVPRAVRDAMYRWVARHRYRWFGRQNACMVPTPEQRNRFLDAGPTLSDAVELSAPRHEPVVRAPITSFLHRVVLVYLAAYVFPFPLGWLPLTERIGRAFDSLQQRIVIAFGHAALGLDLKVVETGSGDTAYAYVQLLLLVILTPILALAWTLLARGGPVSPRTTERLRTYARYYLAAILFAYGWGKVIPVQMPAPGPDRLLNTIGNTSPMGMLWTLMGTSFAYQVFAGLGETAAGFLLFWRRTALAGALVGCAVLTNIVMLNFCFDVPVKLFSSHLLLVGLFLIAPHAMRLLSILVFNLPAQPVSLDPFPIRSAWLRRLGLAAKLALFVVWGIMPAFESVARAREYGFLVKHTSFHGNYRVDSFVRDGLVGSANEDSVRWVRFAINDMGFGAIQRASGATGRCLLEIDQAAHTMTITFRGAPAPDTLRYAERPGGGLEISGPFQGSVVSVGLAKLPDDESVLLGRGFRWVTEFPYNR